MKKKFIRALTFIVGLYFFLEFFLPEEIGGDFDKQKVRSPAVVADSKTSKTFLYYVGEYDMRNQAVGLAEINEDGIIKKYDKNPVLRSTLMNSFDRLGFSSLCVAKTDKEYLMFYIGKDLDRLETICWASSADGIKWEKQGRMVFDELTPWRQIYEEERSYTGKYFGSIKSIAVGCHNNTALLFIAYVEKSRTKIGIGRQLENGKWHFIPDAIPVDESKAMISIANLSCTTTAEGNELWIYFADGDLYRKPSDNNAPMEKVPVELTKTSIIVENQNLTISIEYSKPENFTVFFNDGQYTIWYTRTKDIVITAPLSVVGTYEIAKIPVKGIFTLKSENKTQWDINPGTLVLQGGMPSHSTFLTKGMTFASDSLEAIGAFAIGLGVVNLCMIHGKNLAKSRKGLHNSIILLICLISMFIFTLLGKPVHDAMSADKAQQTQNKPEYEKKDIVEKIEKEYLESKTTRAKVFLAKSYNFTFEFLLKNLGTTVFSLISFYMVGAAFRSFRVKSFEALLLVISALIALLGQIPIGAAMSPQISESGARLIPTMSQKLMMIVNAAAYRGVILGMTIGALSMSLRLWLGLERGMFHGTQ